MERLKRILTDARYTLVIDTEAKNFCGFQVKYDRDAAVLTMTLSVEKILEKALIGGYNATDKLRTKTTPYPTAIAQDNRNYDPREQKADESRMLDTQELKLLQDMIGEPQNVTTNELLTLENTASEGAKENKSETLNMKINPGIFTTIQR